ncbi:MAG: PP2C family protein-serine/threonine phosphatase [Spirochaetia bacterium]
MENVDIREFETENSRTAEEEIDSTGNTKVIQLQKSAVTSGETIAKLISSRWYVHRDSLLLDVGDDLRENPDIHVIGVVDDDTKIAGIIVRRHILDLLARPFGRDVLRNETVGNILHPVRAFYFDMNALSVGELLDQETAGHHISYYALKFTDHTFTGIVSSQDILVYLSGITKKDITLARKIQTKIVKEFIQIEQKNFDLVCTSQMARGVGGDFYTYRNYAPGKWFICICDVSGKGMAASLVTCALWGMIDSYDFRKGIIPLISELNSFLMDTFDLEKFVTGTFLDLNEETGNIEIADMGHGYAYFLKKGEFFRVKSSDSNLPIGISDTLDPKAFRYKLQENDFLIFITDGLVEQTNVEGKEMSVKPVLKILREYESRSLTSIKVKLLEELHSFRGTKHLQDDVTFLLLRYLKNV